MPYKTVIPMGIGDYKPCAVPQCGEGVAGRHLMCKKHWAMVPADQQRAVVMAWSAMQGNHGLEELSIRVRSHQIAAERALNTVLALLEAEQAQTAMRDQAAARETGGLDGDDLDSFLEEPEDELAEETLEP